MRRLLLVSLLAASLLEMLAFKTIPRRLLPVAWRSSSIRKAVTSDVETVESTTGGVPESDLFAIELPTNERNPELLKIRHTTAHVMAMAVQKLHPKAQVTIGPWIENGFYYDFFIPEEQLSDSDLKQIKKEMDKIIKADYPIRREEVSRDEARQRILAQNEPFKLEILDSIKTEPITIYHIGDEVTDIAISLKYGIMMRLVVGPLCWTSC